MPPFQQQNIKLRVDEYPHVLLAYYIHIYARSVCVSVCARVCTTRMWHTFIAPLAATPCLCCLLPLCASACLCLCVCVNYLMVCKFAMRCVAAWFQFCGWRKINFVSGLFLPLCCIALPVASCRLPVASLQFHLSAMHCAAERIRNMLVLCAIIQKTRSAHKFNKPKMHEGCG